MANPRVLTKRRKAVRNIRKITHTMQLIATSRYQKALTKATASKPYAERITELVQELSGAGEQVRHPLLETHPDAKRSILLVVTSNRGLCGGYNSGLLRMARKRARQVEQSGQAVELNVIGKKGVGYYNFLKQPLAKAVSDFPDTPTFVDVEPLLAAPDRRQSFPQNANGLSVIDFIEKLLVCPGILPDHLGLAVDGQHLRFAGLLEPVDVLPGIAVEIGQRMDVFDVQHDGPWLEACY